jgi:osmoprotectant transport system permease protein
MDKLYQFIIDPSNDYWGHSVAYIELCVASIVLATVIGGVLGAVVSRSPLLAFLAVNISGLMRAIPVIAFLVAVLPYLGLGFLPALIALTVLGIPPILLNTYTGIRGINPAIIDAARGMGMTTRQIITRIQAPLVLPIIAAGVRTSAVQVIATATLAAIIGAGGYGEYILSGLYQLDNVQILAGAIPVAILAILAEVLLSQLQRVLTPAGLRI